MIDQNDAPAEEGTPEFRRPFLFPCPRSMVVHELISFWENWSKEPFEKSGGYALEGSLAPVEIDLDSQSGTYEEPNVWVSYGG